MELISEQDLDSAWLATPFKDSGKKADSVTNEYIVGVLDAGQAAQVSFSSVRMHSFVSRLWQWYVMLAMAYSDDIAEKSSPQQYTLLAYILLTMLASQCLQK